MKLIFLYGMPASGKLTVARELANITGFPLFHNHLAVDLLLSTFEFGSAPFVELREQIWLSVFEQAAKNGTPGLIFTFAPEATVRPTFLPALTRALTDAGATIEYIELTAPVAELKRRIGDASRRQYKKLDSIALFDQLHAEGAFHAFPMPQPRLSIDTSTVPPARAALLIARALELSGLRQSAART
jgi:predicted kinase